jgi:hypothetical protein
VFQCPPAQAEVRVLLSSADLQRDQVLWVQADPNQIEVAVTGNSLAKSQVEVRLADRESGSSDEVYQADFLGSNGTLTIWSGTAAPRTYTIQLSGKNLAALKRREQESLASMLTVPERRIRLDGKGRASAILDPRSWDKDDVVMAGTTLGIATPRLGVACPQWMAKGPISISLDAGRQSTGAEMAVAVLSGKSLASVLAENEKQSASLNRTVQLRHKVDADKGEQDGSVDATVGRAAGIRVAAVGGSDRIASITAKAESVELDSTKYRGSMVLGPDPIRRPVSVLQRLRCVKRMESSSTPL